MLRWCLTSVICVIFLSLRFKKIFLDIPSAFWGFCFRAADDAVLAARLQQQFEEDERRQKQRIAELDAEFARNLAIRERRKHDEARITAFQVLSLDKTKKFWYIRR